MRISELFRFGKWSTGVVTVIISGHLASGVQAQSVAQIKSSGPQQPGQLSQAENFLRDAETAIGRGDTAKAHQCLQVAEAMLQQSGNQAGATVERIDQLRRQLGSDPAVASRTASGPANLLLSARQAIARGDTATASSLLEQARASGTDFSKLGDSPEAVARLVDRQNALVKLANSGDASAFNQQAAMFLLEQARDLLAMGDHQSTILLVEQARKFPVDLAKSGLNPDGLLTRAREMAKSTAAESPLAKARRLTSMAMLAIDRKEFSDARRMLDEAMALQVPDREFSANETRPWQVELALQKAAGATTVDGQVRPASANLNEQPGAVRRADYDPAADTTRNMQVGLQTEPGAAATGDMAAAQGAEELNLTAPLDAEQKLFREMQSTVFRERAAAERMMSENPRAALDRMVGLRGQISTSALSQENRNPLLTIIDRDIREMQRYIDGNLPDILNVESNTERLEGVDLARERRYEVELQIQKLVEDMNRLIEQKRYREAEVVCRQAVELAPENAEIAALSETVRNRVRYEEMMALKGIKEAQIYEEIGPGMEQLSTPSVNLANPQIYNDLETYERRMQMREEWAAAQSYDSDAERQIWNQLKNARIQGEFRGSLSEVVTQIAAQAGVNIVFDAAAMEAENITTDKMVDVPISNPISLESVLKIVLGNVGLVFVVEDEVIKVTSRSARGKELKQKTYYVGDLVFPVNIQHSPQQMNFVTPSMQMNSTNRLLSQNGPGAAGANGPVNPLVLAQQIQGMNNPLAGAALGSLNDYRGGGGPQTGVPTYTTTGPSPLGGITLQDFQPLINLIEQTIASESWANAGNGEGTMQAFVPNLSLVVSNTQEVQDQIQDLLTRLRQLNDVQIVVEVRFITLRDSFFERVGIDFDFKINDNSGITPNTQPGDRVARSTVTGNIGVDGTGYVAPGDLDINFGQNSFASAVPQFPQFDPGSAANFGFAILSDIEVFFLLQASKGDERTNVAQAPVVTMFNGQSASVFDGAVRPFVTSVVPVVGDFAVAQQPIISMLPEGTALNVQAVASNDRRHVTLSLNPFFSQVTDVQEFTFDGTRRIVRSSDNLLTDLTNLLDNDPNNDSDEGLQIEQDGVTIQLPVLATTTVSTVVQVPDGGTVLMGGVKRLSEGRTERGVPFLSQIPYVNRLFKNVGIGRETSNLMMMVTPRIIIQEEEEDLQVGASGGN